MLTSSFPRLFHAVLVDVQGEQHVRVPVLFFGGVGPLAAVTSCDGRVQKPGRLLRGWSSQLRLVLELRNGKKREGSRLKLLAVASVGVITMDRAKRSEVTISLFTPAHFLLTRLIGILTQDMSLICLQVWPAEIGGSADKQENECAESESLWCCRISLLMRLCQISRGLHRCSCIRASNPVTAEVQPHRHTLAHSLSLCRHWHSARSHVIHLSKGCRPRP